MTKIEREFGMLMLLVHMSDLLIEMSLHNVPSYTFQQTREPLVEYRNFIAEQIRKYKEGDE